MQYDIIIVGGGIVGLATAYKLQLGSPLLKILILEKESEVAKHQTGNNSGVIHSGLYYKPGSLKAKNCIDGYHQLISFCTEHNVPYELCGKVVVATKEHELPLLENLYTRGQQNGLTGLIKLDKNGLKEYEPHLSGISGFFVPQTGIVDYKLVAQKYATLLQDMGTTIILNEKVIEIQKSEKHLVVATQKATYNGTLLINCAGLYSDKVARLTSEKVDVKIIPFRGEYFKLKKKKGVPRKKSNLSCTRS